MKRCILTVFFVMFTTLGQLWAGEPTTVWPYLYDDFMDAYIFNEEGERSRAKINIHLMHNDLHYLNGERIFSADYKNTVTRIILEDSTQLVRCEKYFIEVLGETPQAIVGRRTVGDYDRLTQGTGAYGTTSSTSATDKMSSAPFVSTPIYHQISNDRENGQTLPLTVRYCFVVNNEIVFANKKAVSRLLPEADQKEFAVFLKTNKIKWKNPESLQKVLEYISPRLSQK